MSRAFVKEPDGDQVPDDQPEIPISPHPNYVTHTGLQQLQDKRANLLQKKEMLEIDKENISNKMSLAQIERELRYLNARINSAILVNIDAIDKNIIAFGASVQVIDDKNKTYKVTIVGEDEADFEENKISWISPLAKVLIGKNKGDKAIWKRPIGDLNVEVQEIRYK